LFPGYDSSTLMLDASTCSARRRNVSNTGAMVGRIAWSICRNYQAHLGNRRSNHSSGV
jgi:hypothetical protein